MNAITAARLDAARDCDPRMVSPECREYARERCKVLLAIVKGRKDTIVKGRKDTIVSVTECVRILGIGRHQLRRLISNHLVWSEHRQLRHDKCNRYYHSVVVDTDDVRRILVEKAAQPKAEEELPPERDPVPPGWIAITDLAAEVAVNTNILGRWCRKGWISGKKYCRSRGNKRGGLEWHVERKAAIAFLREKLAGHNQLRRDMSVPSTPLVEAIWRKPEIVEEVAAFWRQDK